MLRHQSPKPKKMHEKVHAATQPRNIQVQSIFSHPGPSLERLLGGRTFIFSCYARLISFQIKLISKEISRA